MAQFNADPNKPGWGTYVNDHGQAAYDYFPSLAPQTQALSPSASGPTAPLQVAGGAPDSSTGGAPPMASMPTEPMQSMQPEPNMSAAPVAVPAGVHPQAGKILGALNAATRPPVSSVSTTSTPGRAAPAVARDKAALGANLTQAQTTNTEIGAARAARQTTQAQGAENAELSTSLNAAGELSSDLGAQRENQTKLSDTLAEKDPAVDPGRLIRNLSTGDTIALTILAALSGGFAATAGMKSNPALDAIDKAVNADVRSQEMEIESGRIRRGNLVQAYRERGMDLRQSIAAARATITESSRRFAEAQAQELGAAAHPEEAKLLNQGLASAYQQQVMALDASGEARSQTTVERKPGAGGAATDPIKRQTEIEAATKAMRANGRSEEQIAGFLKTLGVDAPASAPAPGAGKFNRDQARLMAVNTDIKDKLQEYASLNGFTYDESSGTFLEGTGEGTKMALPQFASEQNAAIQQNVESIAPSIGLVQNGGLAPQEHEVQSVVANMTAHAAKVRLAALNSHWKAVNNVIEGVEKYPGGVEQNDQGDGRGER